MRQERDIFITEMQKEKSIIREFINLQFGLDRQVTMNVLKDTISGPHPIDNILDVGPFKEAEDSSLFVSKENEQISVIDRLNAVE